jgi:general stress protein 26
MDKIVTGKISEYLATHTFLRLATVSQEGNPMAHTLAYIASGLTVYFFTNKNSRKAVNMLNNPWISYVVDENNENISQVKGVQIDGKASLVTDEAELNKVIDLQVKKYPFMAKAKPSPDMCFFKLSPISGAYLDYTVSFGHRDNVTFE